MSDKPDMKALAEQIRAFAAQPHMQGIKRQMDSLDSNPPEHIANIRENLRAFSERLKTQNGQRGQSGVEPIKTVVPVKKRRGRPSGAQYPSDAQILIQMRTEMLRTGERRVETIARQFAREADGGGTVASKTTRLAKAYREKFGRAAERN